MGIDYDVSRRKLKKAGYTFREVLGLGLAFCIVFGFGARFGFTELARMSLGAWMCQARVMRWAKSSGVILLAYARTAGRPAW